MSCAYAQMGQREACLTCLEAVLESGEPQEGGGAGERREEEERGVGSRRNQARITETQNPDTERIGRCCGAPVSAALTVAVYSTLKAISRHSPKLIPLQGLRTTPPCVPTPTWRRCAAPPLTSCWGGGWRLCGGTGGPGVWWTGGAGRGLRQVKGGGAGVLRAGIPLCPPACLPDAPRPTRACHFLHRARISSGLHIQTTLRYTEVIR